MQVNDIKEFTKVMYLLGSAFGREIKKELIDVYWEILKELSLEQFKNKAYILIKTNKYFPVIAEFLEVPDKQDKSILAWQKVLYAFKIVNCWNSVQFDDSVIHSAIEMLGGWRRFNEMTIEERKWAEKDFYKYYSAMQNKDAHPKYLVGYSEFEQNRDGFFDMIKAPIKVYSDLRGEILVQEPKEVKLIEEYNKLFPNDKIDGSEEHTSELQSRL